MSTSSRTPPDPVLPPTGRSQDIRADPPECSVVIITWNRRQALGPVLEALFAQTLAPRMEVLLIDNASTDGTLEWVRSRWAVPVQDGRLRLFQYARNQGGTRARNGGIRLSRAAHVCFLDSDAVLMDRHTLSGCLAILRGDASARAITVPIWLDRERTRPFTLGCYMTPEGHYDHPRSTRDSDDPMTLSTCFSIWEKSFLEELRGFDTTFFLGLEDLDLGWRAWESARRRQKSPLEGSCGKAVGPFCVTHDAGGVWHMLSPDGRVLKPEQFDGIFTIAERHRLYLVLAARGLRAFFEVLVRGPWRTAHWERVTYQRPLTLGQKCRMAWGYPLLRLMLLPYDLWRIRRNHLAVSPLPEEVTGSGEQNARPTGNAELSEG